MPPWRGRSARIKPSRGRGDSGTDYQLELSILWDRHPNGSIRIVGSIDDGGLGAFLPLTDSRLMKPEGS